MTAGNFLSALADLMELQQLRWPRGRKALGQPMTSMKALTFHRKHALGGNSLIIARLRRLAAKRSGYFSLISCNRNLAPLYLRLELEVITTTSTLDAFASLE